MSTVSDPYKAIYLFCSKCLESVHVRTKTQTLRFSQTCAQAFERVHYIWTQIHTSSGGVLLHGYVDSDWAGSSVDQKSTSGYCFNIGSTMTSWSSRKQGSIAQSIAKAEYIAASDASREAVWLRKLLLGLFQEKLETTVSHCDNQRYIKLKENLVFHDKSKHIEMKCHYIKDTVQRCAIKLQYIHTDEQIVDILTKPLSFGKFVHFRDKLGVAENVSLAKREC